jgi:hypothetical protein
LLWGHSPALHHPEAQSSTLPGLIEHDLIVLPELLDKPAHRQFIGQSYGLQDLSA